MRFDHRSQMTNDSGLEACGASRAKSNSIRVALLLHWQERVAVADSEWGKPLECTGSPSRSQTVQRPRPPSDQPAKFRVSCKAMQCKPPAGRRSRRQRQLQQNQSSKAPQSSRCTHATLWKRAGGEKSGDTATNEGACSNHGHVDFAAEATVAVGDQKADSDQRRRTTLQWYVQTHASAEPQNARKVAR